jgi:uncharacterized membrane protein (DUF4010 family)
VALREVAAVAGIGMDLDLARHFLAAVLIGALVGIEREKRKHADPARAFGGIRTHILLALAGGAAAWLARARASPGILVATLLAVAAVGVADHVRRGRGAQDGAPGIVSEIAAFLVVLLGALVVVGDAALAVALAIAVSAVLAFRQPLHGLVERIGVDDLLAGIKLLIASFIVLPLLPDAPVDPWGAVNPYQLWLMVIAISAFSLVGYVAMRWLGKARGLAITGLAGGLTSSTATTLNIARGSRPGTPGASGDAASAGILLAWLMMFLRVMAIVFATNRGLFAVAWPPLAVMAALTALLAGRHYLRGAGDPSATNDLPVGNPFSLASAMRLGGLFAGLLIAIRIAGRVLPASGLYVVSGLAGALDVDAITLSLTSGGEPAGPATAALVVALLANTTLKCAAVVVVARGAVRRHVAVASVAIGVVGAGATVLALA